MVQNGKESKQVLMEKAGVYHYEDKLKNKKDGLPEKHFIHRESVLTVLFQNPHVKTIHHMFAALFLSLVLVTVTRDILENHEVVLGFRLIVAGFGKLPIALTAWPLYFLFTCSTYFCFKIWANIRTKFGSSKKSLNRLWDSAASLILLSYYIFSFRMAVYIVTTFELPPASAAIILVEQTRMLMKVHAFIRSNIPKVLAYKEKSDQSLVLPTFGNFVYFTLVPALVYKDEYPRTSTIRWKVVATHALEIFAVILFYSFVMERFLIPMYRDFGIRKFTHTELLLTILETSFPGGLYLMATFYLILHLVQNFFAEILCFGDRMFYKDWWTSTDFTTWYRTWNVVVHDWLYTYIYKDCYEILVPGNKMFAKYATFFISSIVHEWIMMHMFGFFFPVMFTLFFVFSTILTHFKIPRNSFLNILFWMSLSYGTGFMVSGYMLEFFARYNNVKPINEVFDFYIPRCMTCDCYV